MNIHFYPRPVLAFRYCGSLRLCLSVCLSVCQSLAWDPYCLWGAIDLDLQGQIWVKKSNFQVLPYWKYITTKEPWVPRLFHGSDCFTVSIRCMCSYAKTVSRSQLFHSQHVAPILIWAAEGMSALTSLWFFHDLTRTWGASYMHENQRIRMSWTYLDGFCNQQGHPGEGGRTWYDDR